MLDLKWIRENPEALDKALERRGAEPLSKQILKLDSERREIISSLQEAQTRRNQLSKEIGKAKGAKDEAKAQALMAEVAALKDRIAEAEPAEKAIEARLNDILAGTPNLPDEDVPLGDESANKEIRRWRDKPNFAFAPKQHFELGEALGMMDFETAAKLSGSRFVVLKGALTRLERALANFMLDLHTGEFGYEEVAPPLLVRNETMFGTAQLPKFRDDQFGVKIKTFQTKEFEVINLQKLYGSDNFDEAINFKHQSERKLFFDAVAANNKNFSYSLFDGEAHILVERQMWLVPTAEVPLTNLVREEILDPAALPMRVTAHTPCFRSEAGAAGKDTRGMIRLHQFSKVELVSITTPEQSEAEHQRMTECAEEVLKRLQLPFRTLVLASGDMGFSARKTYDIEVWLPGQDAYREISSCSNCGDFQARRMNARFRPEGGKDLRFVHTLNGSGLAVGRTLVAVLENYQQEDGSIRVPDVLIPYMGGVEVIEARK